MDRTLLEIFVGEQSEHVQRIRALIDILSTVPPERLGTVFDELLRRAHTLKGASRAVGLEPTESLVHRAESVFVLWRSQGAVPEEASRALIHRTLDGVEDILAWALGARSEPDTGPVLIALDILAGKAPQSETATPASATKPMETASEPEPKFVSGAPASETVRVDTMLLDEVVRSASLLVHMTYSDASADSRVTRYARLVEQTVEEYSRLRRSCGPIIRGNREAPEFRPIVDCIEYLDRQLRQLLSEAQKMAAARQQDSRALRLRAEEMHENACRARMTPAQAVFGVFGAMVRDLAGQESKQIDLQMEGLEVQADREVLQALKNPVIHILRNAVSHGIETPQERAAAGKAREGVIRLQVASRGDRLHVTAEDDGRGLDIGTLVQKAVRQGLITEAVANTASADVLARLIFQPGLTTSSAVTSLAGRGMGLSAVGQAVATLQGDIGVRQRAGRGLTITIVVPMNISTQHVLMVRERNQVFGIPAAFVERLCRLRPSDVRWIGGIESMVVDEKPVPLVRLADLLGLATGQDSSETTMSSSGLMYQVAILSSGGERTGVVIEELLDERETLVKNSGLPLSASGWSTGAIALEDGSVAVVLNGSRLLQRFETIGVGRTTFQSERTEAKKRRILVVDDSVTTRALERSLLEAHGYEVSLAVDGLEGWNAVQQAPPDLVISDVDMPRMDGFQLLERIKSQKSSERIPVILLTSLESREEQEKGLSLGADAYIIKRKFDQRELLKVVQQIL